MNANQIKAVLAETKAMPGYRGESRLWQIRDLRAAGLDFETARFCVENPDCIDEMFPGDAR